MESRASQTNFAETFSTFRIAVFSCELSFYILCFVVNCVFLTVYTFIAFLSRLVLFLARISARIK